MNYPLNHSVRLLGPTLIYIDSEGSLIELRLNDQQVQSIVTDWNSQPDEELSEDEARHMLKPPQGHVAVYAPPS